MWKPGNLVTIQGEIYRVFKIDTLYPCVLCDFINIPIHDYPCNRCAMSKTRWSKKVIDENGEPLVVYHGTSKENARKKFVKVPENCALVKKGTPLFNMRRHHKR